MPRSLVRIGRSSDRQAFNGRRTGRTGQPRNRGSDRVSVRAEGEYKAYWLHPGQAKDDPATDNQFTEYAYPSRAEATAAAVLLRYEEARARALAAQAEADREAAEVAAEQEHNYNAMIGESLRSRP